MLVIGSSGPKQNSIVRGNFFSLYVYDGRLTVPVRLFLLCLFCVLLLVPYGAGKAGVDDPLLCEVDTPCNVSFVFDTVDPEQDKVQVNFDITSGQTPPAFTILACTLSNGQTSVSTTQPNPPGPDYSSCSTPWLAGANLNAVGTYLFRNTGNYTSHALVCDDAGHCTATQQSVLVQPYPSLLSLGVSPASTNQAPVVSWHAKNSLPSSGGAPLSRADIFRAAYNNNGCTDVDKSSCAWTQAGSVTPSNTTDWNGSYPDTALVPTLGQPSPYDGRYWYGVHIWNTASRCITEGGLDCTSHTAVQGHSALAVPGVLLDTTPPHTTTGQFQLQATGVTSTSITWTISPVPPLDGGVGLGATPYGISTVSRPNNFAPTDWRASYSFTQSLSCGQQSTMYASVRDALDNRLQTSSGAALATLTATATATACQGRQAELQNPNPSVGGWYKTPNTTFSYTPFCKKQESSTSLTCTTKVSFNNGTDWPTAQVISTENNKAQAYTLQNGYCHVFRVEEVDSQGHVESSQVPSTGQICRDDTLPTTVFNAPPVDSYQNANFSATVTDVDTGGSNLATCYWGTSYLSNSPSYWVRECNKAFTVTVDTRTGSTANCAVDDTCVLIAYAVDQAGNEGAHAQIQVKVDATAPVVQSLTVATSPTNSRPQVNFTISDAWGYGLQDVTLWRAKTLTGPWTDTGVSVALAGVPNYSGSLVDTSLRLGPTSADDGSYYYSLHVLDLAKNCITETGQHCGGTAADRLDPRAARGPVAVIYDTTAPPRTTVTVSPARSNLTPAFTITWTKVTDALSGLNHYELLRSPNGVDSWASIQGNIPPTSGACATTPCSTTDTPTSNGWWWYGIHAVDNANNSSSEIAPPPSGFWDNVKPVTTITAPLPDHSVQGGNFTVTVSDTDASPSSGFASCSYFIEDKNDSGVWTITRNNSPSRTCPNGSISVNTTSDCRYQGADRCRVNAWATDQAGNVGLIDTKWYGISLGGRGASLIGTPSVSGWTNTTTFTYTPTCTPQSGFSLTGCDLLVSTNGGAQVATAVTSGVQRTYTMSSGSTYTFQVRETDQNSPPSALSNIVPPSGTIQVDAVAPPRTTVTVSPARSNLTPAFTITWSKVTDALSGLNHYELWRSPDGLPSTWILIQPNIPPSSGACATTPCSTTDTPSSNGWWWYGIHAVDNANNSSTENPPAPSGFWDNVKPVTTITAPLPDHSVQGGNFTVTVSDTDASPSSGFASCSYFIEDKNDSGVWTTTRNNSPSRTCPNGSISVNTTTDCRYQGADRCRVNAWATDQAGNVGLIDTKTYGISTTSNSASFIDQSTPTLAPGWQYRPKVFTYTASCTEAGGSVFQACNVQVAVDTVSGGCWGNGTTCGSYLSTDRNVQHTFTMSSGSSYQFRVIEQDDHGSSSPTLYPASQFKLDAVAPQVSQFTITNLVLSSPPATNQRPTFALSVSDTGGSLLLRLELWRAQDNNGSVNNATWQKVSGRDNLTPSTTLTDDPTLSGSGNWWYGLHAIDTAGNCIDEQGSHSCGGVSSDSLDTTRQIQGPRRVVYDISAPTPDPPTLSVVNKTSTSITWGLSSGSDGSGAGMHQQPYGFAPAIGGGGPGVFNWFNTNQWVETGLQPSTSYTRYGKLRDALGNESATLAQLTVTTDTGQSRSASLTDTSSPQLLPGWHNKPTTFSYTPVCQAAAGSTPSQNRFCVTEVSTSAQGGGCWGNASNCGQSLSTANNTPQTFSGFISGATYQFRVVETDSFGTTTFGPYPGSVFKIDTTYPTLSSFTAQAAVTKTAPKLNFGGSDAGGSGLQKFELWRATYSATSCSESIKTGCDWGTTPVVDNIPATATNQIDETLSGDGKYWYGLHVVDAAGNCLTEGAKDCTSGSAVTGTALPLQLITYDTTAPVASVQQLQKLVLATNQRIWVAGLGGTTNLIRPGLTVNLTDTSGMVSSTISVYPAGGPVAIVSKSFTTETGLTLSGGYPDNHPDWGNSILDNIIYEVRVQAVDQVGNSLDTRAWTFTVANAKPDPPIIK